MRVSLDISKIPLVVYIFHMHVPATPDLTPQPPAGDSVEEIGTYICELHLNSMPLAIDF
jgi:hypothetical protein